MALHRKQRIEHSEEYIQNLLIGYWKEVLKIDSVGLDDNFFELGGTSLCFLDVYNRLHRLYDREFPIFELSIVPTIRTLTKHIREELLGLKSCGYRALRNVQPGVPGDVPLFLVHGGDGNARVFMRLAKNLNPNIPVYAFQWPGWDGARGMTSLRKMAAFYVEELLRFRPEGPIRIGGYCMGGLIAIEMSHILKRKGVKIISPLLVWDTLNVRASSRRLTEPWNTGQDREEFLKMKADFKENRKQNCTDPVELELPRGGGGKYDFLYRRPRLFALVRTIQLITFGIVPIELMLLVKGEVPIKWRWRYCMVTSYFAQMKYANTEKFRGEVIYFRSDCLIGRPLHLDGWWSDLYMGVGEICENEIQGYVVGGDHVTVLDKKMCAEIVNTYYEPNPEQKKD